MRARESWPGPLAAAAAAVEPRAGGNADVDPGTKTLAPFRAVYPGERLARG